MMCTTHRSIMLCAAAAAVSLPSFAPAAETLWSRQLASGACDTSIAYADAADPPGQELVMTTTSGAVLIWNTAGELLHKVQLGGVFATPPTVADVYPGGPAEILVVDQAGRVTCLRGPQTLWQYPLPAHLAWNNTTIVAEDLDGDGRLDILVGDMAGHLVCLTPEGVERWQHELAGGFHCPPAVADLADRPGREIVCSTGGKKLVCLSAEGQRVWETDLGCDNTSGPVIADLDGDGAGEIVIGGKDGRLHCFAADGKPKWTFAATAEIDSALSCGDLDGDGKLEIVIVDLRGKCFCVGADGKQRWTYDVGNRCRRPASLADFDGDGAIEVLVVGYGGRMYLLSHDGQEKDIVNVPGGTNGGATVIESRGRLAAVVPYSNGKAECYTWLRADAARGQRVVWGAYRVTPSQRGSVGTPTADTQRPARQRISYGDLLVGRNVFEVDIANPKGAPLHVALHIRKPLTDEHLRQTVESDKKRITASLPYLVRGAAPETIVFSFRVTPAGASRPVLTGRKAVFVEPFLRDLDAPRHLIERLKNAETRLRETHGRNTDALTGRRLWFEHRLAAFAERVSHPSRLSGADRVACAGDLKRLSPQVAQTLALAQLTLACLDAKQQAVFATWPANPWAPIRTPGDRAGQERTSESPDDMSLTLYRQERGALALDLLNLLDRPLDLRLRFPDRFTDDRSPALDVKEVIAVPTELETYSADAISALNQARVLHLAPGEARQLWIGVNATGSAPGKFTCKLNLSSLTTESVTEDVELTVHVLDLDLTAAPAPRFCNWAYVHSSCVRDYGDEARTDLADHGTNVFVVTGAHLPHIAYDKNGQLVGDADFSKHDTFIRGHRDDAMFLFIGHEGTLRGPKGYGAGSDAYRKAFGAWIPRWVAHLKALGVGYDRFAFYPVDEPGLNPGLVERYIASAKLVRETDPNILMYTDPVGRATAEEIERMAPYVDIWCPNRGGFMMTPEEDPRLAIMRERGRQVWTYECDHNAKHQSPLGYYRGLAWLAERNHMTGIGFWSYCTSQWDPWYLPRGGHDYLLIYPGRGIVTSKRWEACLDGLEDLRAAWQLRSLADTVRRSNPDDDRVKRADQVLAEATAELSEFCRTRTVHIPAAPGTAPTAEQRAELDAFDTQYRAYRRHRRRIAEATIALRK